jgi:hypothetical protein
MQKFLLRSLGLPVLILAGCSDSSQPKSIPSAGTNATASAAMEKQNDEGAKVMHPEFANWSRFPKGTRVVRSKLVENSAGKLTELSTLTLVENNASEVEIAMQITTIRDDGEVRNEPMSMKFPAAFRLPPGMNKEQFELPSTKAKLVEEVEVEVAGNRYPCKVYSWTESNEAGPMPVKVWYSDLFPGRLVRQETITESTQTKRTEEVKSIEIPKSE